MDDVISIYAWPQDAPPFGAALWPQGVLHLDGKGEESHIWTAPCFRMYLVVRGRGTVRREGIEVAVCVGDMFCFSPGGWTEWEGDPADPWEVYGFGVFGPSSLEYVRAFGFTLENPRIRPRHFVETRRLFRRIYDCHRTRQAEDVCRMIAALYSLIPACVELESADGDRQTAPEDIMQRVDAIAGAFPGHRLSVSQIAHALHVSRATLHRAFLKEIGTTPSRYLYAMRLQKAKKLLRGTGEKISAIARAAGFSNAGVFHRHFRRAEGVTPSRYRALFPDAAAQKPPAVHTDEEEPRGK